MRYYSIVITKADGTPYTFKSLGSLPLTSLLPSGPQNPRTSLTNPAALQVELDMGVANLADPDTSQGCGLTVWGLGLADLGNAADLNGLNISVYAGMARGLPLADPSQAGLIVQGQIFQAFGSWIGTDQTLNLIITQGGAVTGVPEPANFPFSMPAGMTLATAITNTLKVAMPAAPVAVNISPNLVLNYQQSGHYRSLQQFSDFVKALSVGIVGGTDYAGVQITQNGAGVTVFDGVGSSSETNPKQVAFRDLIGQPTWIGPGAVSFKTVLRADIHLGDTVALPQSLFTQSTASNQYALPQPQNKLTFSGNYIVTQVHHYGHSRQPDAASWNTTFQAAFVIPPVAPAQAV